MRRTFQALGSLVIASTFIAGCAVGDPSQRDAGEKGSAVDNGKKGEPTQQSQEPIYGGSNDGTDDAVMFLYSNQGYACTGTLIAKNGNIGYVLTAGHCAGMDYVIQADNLNCLNSNPPTCENIWAIDDQVVNPNFNENLIDNGYDFSMIRFTGASSAPAPVPAASGNDGVGVGTQVNLVGYGVTEFGDTNFRMHVNMPVNEVFSNFLGFDQTGGQGTCSGDSGGPAIYNGKVVGVTSFGDQNCAQFGYSGRVSFVYNDFIAPYIGAPVEETCNTCSAAAQGSGGACGSQTNACFNNAECGALVDCVNPCTTQSCVDNCYAAHPNGAAALDALIGCICDACAICDCGATTNTVTTVTTGSSMNTGGTNGSGGNANAGGGTASDGGSPNEGGGSAQSSDGGTTDDGCGCVMVGSASAARDPWAGLAGLAFVAGAVARRRRRAA